MSDVARLPDKVVGWKLLLIAALPAIVPATLWLAANVVWRYACPAWRLKSDLKCVVASLDLSWLMMFGLILSPYLLFVTVPLSIVLCAIVLFLRRRRNA